MLSCLLTRILEINQRLQSLMESLATGERELIARRTDNLLQETLYSQRVGGLALPRKSLQVPRAATDSQCVMVCAPQRIKPC